mgnify:FL=1
MHVKGGRLSPERARLTVRESEARISDRVY